MVRGPEIALKLPCNGLEYGLSLWNCKKVLSEIPLGHFNLKRLAIIDSAVSVVHHSFYPKQLTLNHH